MGKIYQNIEELIGRTPLLEVAGIEKELGLLAKILVKLEYLNPAGSVKDRAAKFMIEDAEAKGFLKEGSVIVEPTSGNTGIGLAALAAAKGYRMILTMPETMSVERRNILKAYGAELVLTEGGKGMKGAIEKAQELAAEIPGSFLPGQFDNQANAEAHRRTTGPGDLGGYRRKGRYSCCGCRNRRNDYRSRGISEIPKCRNIYCGSGACGFSGSFRRRSGAA